MDDSKKDKIKFLKIPLDSIQDENDRKNVVKLAELAQASFNHLNKKFETWIVEDTETYINICYIFDLSTIFSSNTDIIPFHDFGMAQFVTIQINVANDKLCFAIVMRKGMIPMKTKALEKYLDKYQDKETKKRKLDEMIRETMYNE